MKLYKITHYTDKLRCNHNTSRGFTTRAAAERFAAGLAASGGAPGGCDISSYEDADESDEVTR